MPKEKSKEVNDSIASQTYSSFKANNSSAYMSLEFSENKDLKVFELLKNETIKSSILKIFDYGFYNIKSEKLKELQENLLNKKENQILESINDWYNKLDKKNDKKNNLPNNSDYVEKKAKNLVDLISVFILFPQRKVNHYLLDIGCGDGSLAYFMNQQFKANEKLRLRELTSHGVDVTEDSDYGEEEGYRKMIKFFNYGDRELKQNQYDLKKASDKLFENNYPKDERYTLISYHHSLHHFGSTGAIKKSLRISSKLLKPNGVVLISEHDNHLDSALLNLFHVFIHINCLFLKKKNPVEGTMKFIQEDLSNIKYLSGNIIKMLAYASNLEVVFEQRKDATTMNTSTQKEKDITNSTYYFLKKREENLVNKWYAEKHKSNRHCFFMKKSFSYDDLSQLKDQSESKVHSL